MANFDIAVLVLTYNSSKEDLLNTLKSIIVQKEVNFKIVICDDGSKNNNEEVITKFFKENKFEHYKAVLNKVNKGTIENILSGLDDVDAPVVKLLSSKDFLYDELSLKKIVDAYQKYSPSVIAGKAVFYSNGKDGAKIIDPTSPHKVFKESVLLNNVALRKQILRHKDWFPGSTLAYDVEQLKTHLQELLKANIKFSEDFSVELIALHGGNLYYINENIVFYEFGSGVSTDTSVSQFGSIANEVNHFFIDYLPMQYPDDKMVRKSKDLMITLNNPNKSKRKMRLLTHHKYFVCYYKFSNRRKTKTNPSNDLLFLNKIIGEC